MQRSLCHWKRLASCPITSHRDDGGVLSMTQIDTLCIISRGTNGWMHTRSSSGGCGGRRGMWCDRENWVVVSVGICCVAATHLVDFRLQRWNVRECGWGGRLSPRQRRTIGGCDQCRWGGDIHSLAKVGTGGGWVDRVLVSCSGDEEAHGR